jgi:hypothetical protein
MNEAKSISVAKAILVGHLCVTGGVFIVLGITTFVCRAFNLLSYPVAIVVGAIVAWPWWSLTVPKWRRWALGRGADAEGLQKIGLRTGLVWPKGCIFEKTEIPPRKW